MRELIAAHNSQLSSVNVGRPSTAQRRPDSQNYDNWGLVQLIALSDDQQLADWLVGTGR